MKNKVYPHLMKGVSEVVPFLILAGFLIGISELLSVFTPSSELLTEILILGQTIYHYSIPLFAAFIALSIADKPAFVPGFIGGILVIYYDEGMVFALLMGFIVGGLVLGFKYVFKSFPKSLNTIKSLILIPLLTTLFTYLIFKLLFLFLPYATNEINFILSTSDGYLIFIIAGLSAFFMAYDMGGPINKIVFLLGIISISYGEKSILMASIMAGGMTPPLGIAIFGLLFKNRFNDDLKLKSKTNFIYGLSFITEGAIPFAAYNKKAVMPSILVGSLFAGLIISFFKTKSAIPHGGIIAAPFMENPLGFLVAILGGSMMTVIMLSFLWKNKINT